MTTITKDKKGNVLSAAADTNYHADGTGPRNADGVLIVDGADQGISRENAQATKRATPSTPAAASPATAAKTEA